MRIDNEKLKSRRPQLPDRIQRTKAKIRSHILREIRVYAKDGPFCATASADELSIEDVLAVEDDVIPLDGADVFQQGEIDTHGGHFCTVRCNCSFVIRESTIPYRGQAVNEAVPMMVT